MRLAHNPKAFSELPKPTTEAPLRILMSACMMGQGCGVDGTDYGMGGALSWLKANNRVHIVHFCPEAHSMGIPRTMPDLHGGDGRDFWKGQAKVLDESGAELSEQMAEGAKAMLAFAQEQRVQLCILTDMSAACGTQVIADGCRFDQPRAYQKGMGVAAAALSTAGFLVLAQRDHKSLGRLRAMIEPGFLAPEGLLDHHEHPWVLENLGYSDVHFG
jgi:uncharacterized protein YbbK (DUF523 family)